MLSPALSHFSLHNVLGRQILLAHSVDGKTENKRSKVICSRSHSKEIPDMGLKPESAFSRSQVLAVIGVIYL